MGTPVHDLSTLRKVVIEGDTPASVAAAHNALDDGVQPLDLISQGIGPAMAEVGKLFEEGEYFVPELLMAARAMKEIFQILRPLLAQTGAKPMPTSCWERFKAICMTSERISLPRYSRTAASRSPILVSMFPRMILLQP
jgi:methanogenic corrinoid protein MtbC1